MARREFRVQPGTPLSQQDMLETQRHLYDLGLFNEVDTAVQNPEGTESRKNVLIATKEAKRYTFDYGFGFEFQTGQPSVGTNQPLGQTGASPKVSFGLTRINVGGRNQTVTMKTSLSRLQQRGLISFEAPKLLNRDLRFSATAFYDNTVDVSTFTSERTEGSVQTVQVLARDFTGQREVTSIAYRFTFRRVQASDIQVSDNLIPLLSKSTRVGLPNFIYIRNKRDNDLETTRGNYTTIEGGVAASYFGSEADFSRLLVKNATYYAFPRSRRTGSEICVCPLHQRRVGKSFGNTVVIGPADATRSSRPEPDPSPGTFFQRGRQLPPRFWVESGGAARSFHRISAGRQCAVSQQSGTALSEHYLALPARQHRFHGFPRHGQCFCQAARHGAQPGPLASARPPRSVFRRRRNDSSKCNYNYLSHAIGVGVRYQTPIGPLRFDFGYNLNPPAFPSYTNIVTNSVNGQRTGQFGAQRAGHFNFSFSVGQSF